MAMPTHYAQVKRYIDRAVQDLPALPSAVAKLLQLTESEIVSAVEIERLVSTDQAICTKLLRVVNSAYFGLSRRISSINQAIVILGYQHVRNIALSIGALSLFKSQSPRMRELHLRVWERSFAAAACSQAIAKDKGASVADQELVFVGGLLHDVGKLFLLSYFSSTYEDVLRYADTRGIEILEAESILLGINHAEIGSQLALAWNLPEELVILIGRHEGPFDGDPIVSLYSTHAGDRIAAFASSTAQEPAPIGLDPAVEAWLGYDDDKMQWVIRETQQKVNEASDLLGLL